MKPMKPFLQMKKLFQKHRAAGFLIAFALLLTMFAVPGCSDSDAGSQADSRQSTAYSESTLINEDADTSTAKESGDLTEEEQAPEETEYLTEEAKTPEAEENLSFDEETETFLTEAEAEETSSIEVTEEETTAEESFDEPAENNGTLSVTEDGTYSSKEEVALYIHLYGHLPSNYITKNEAQDLGWVSSEGNLWDVAPGKSIGGDKFGNREGLLPSASGRKYTECDIDFDGGYRNSKRIIFSNDGLVYYTEDHYESFELLYGEP